ncbi:MAG: DNA polymerase III subunit gamma/tau [Candidatus Pacebacteria bacterium]|nr:DNA polymerase III subunit gamma/tau [Candidatus Paceibacterota bacterium]
MSNNTALYTKYRPQSFKEVVGQEALVEALQQAVKSKTPAHAYIFSGTRGVGKTTVARIFAKELGVSAKDTYELDAASNNSVDDIRDLRESVSTLPFEGDYKVYILDEAHMLSKSAFNAFLKTLEEPPSYCIFILATTEPEKLPDTIHSRSQVYTLNSPRKKELAELIKSIATQEGYQLGDGADDLIAALANGSFRDGISALQKVLASTDSKTILVDDVERITGAPKGALLNDILTGIAGSNTEQSLTAISELVQGGVGLPLSIELLLERARAVLLLRHGGTNGAKILAQQFGKDDLVELQVLADNKESKLRAGALLELLHAQAHMHSSSIKHLPLELAIIKLSEL